MLRINLTPFWYVLGPTEKNVITDRSHIPGYHKITQKNLFMLHPVDKRMHKKVNIMLGMKSNVKDNNVSTIPLSIPQPVLYLNSNAMKKTLLSTENNTAKKVITNLHVRSPPNGPSSLRIEHGPL